MLAGTARLAWRLAEGERRQANRLLETHLPPVPPPRRAAAASASSSAAARSGACSAMLLLKLPVALAGLVVAGAARRCSRSRSPGSG